MLAIFTATQRWGEELAVDRGCAHAAAAVQRPADHPGVAVAAAHKQHLADRLHEPCTATSAADPEDMTQDLLLIYEGAQTMITMQTTPDAGQLV